MWHPATRLPQGKIVTIQDALGPNYLGNRWHGMRGCSKSNANVAYCRLPPQTAAHDPWLAGLRFHKRLLSPTP